MGVKPMFSNGVVAAQVQAFQENLEKAILSLLKYLGEELAKYARDNHTYTDQTGNLTNSIGYAVVRNKEIISFGGATQPGVSVDSALKVVNDMLSDAQSSYSLIIVAGMNYAAYVEAKGYNVILPAELKAKKDFPTAMNKIINKVLSKISSNN